jgi:hypothetical protein
VLSYFEKTAETQRSHHSILLAPSGLPHSTHLDFAVLYDTHVGTRLGALRAGGLTHTGASMSASRSHRFDETRPGSKPAPHTRVPQWPQIAAAAHVHTHLMQARRDWFLTFHLNLRAMRELKKSAHKYLVVFSQIDV